MITLMLVQRIGFSEQTLDARSPKQDDLKWDNDLRLEKTKIENICKLTLVSFVTLNCHT